APPCAFDAFGSFRANHFVQGAAPAEAHRRAVRHEGEDVGDGLGLGEQTQWARAQLSLGAEAAERVPAKLGARHDLRRDRRGGGRGGGGGMWGSGGRRGETGGGPSRALRRSTRRSSSA